MTVNTQLFGFGDTTETMEELVRQINQGIDLVEESLDEFIKLRNNRENNKAYYNDEGNICLTKIVEYQNGVNVRIGKLWNVYKKEVLKYHRTKHAELEKMYSPEIVVPEKSPSHVAEHNQNIVPHYAYQALDDFNAENENELDMTKGRYYYVMNIDPSTSDWALVKDITDYEKDGYVPTNLLDERTKYEVRHVGFFYKAENDFDPEGPYELKLTTGENYFINDILDNGWSLVSDKDGNEGLVPTNYLSERTNSNSDEIRFLQNFYYIDTNTNKIVKYLHDDVFEELIDGTEYKPLTENIEKILPGTILKAIYDFNAIKEDEISLKENIEYYILEYIYNNEYNAEWADWIKVYDYSTGEEGYAPISFFDLENVAMAAAKCK